MVCPCRRERYADCWRYASGGHGARVVAPVSHNRSLLDRLAVRHSDRPASGSPFSSQPIESATHLAHSLGSLLRDWCRLLPLDRLASDPVAALGLCPSYKTSQDRICRLLH